jgi:hypothetical protein
MNAAIFLVVGIAMMFAVGGRPRIATGLFAKVRANLPSAPAYAQCYPERSEGSMGRSIEPLYARDDTEGVIKPLRLIL